MTEPAFDIKDVFDRYFSSLVLFADRYINDREESKSIVQDAFVFLWESRNSFTNELAMKSWLYTTVHNKSLNFLKRSQLKQDYYKRQAHEEKETENFYMQSLIEEETYRLLFEAIERLPEQCRKVCLLNLEGMDNKEIAENMQISVDTVKFHKKNAYKLLRTYLKGMEMVITLLLG